MTVPLFNAPIPEMARHLAKLGANVLPVQPTKEPLPGTNWHHGIDPWEVVTFPPNAEGLAVVAGPGDYRCFDVDGEALAMVPALLGRLGLEVGYPWVVETPSGGFHVWVRATEHGLDQPDPAIRTDAKGAQLVFWGMPEGPSPIMRVELRWARCYALMPPTRRPEGGDYFWLQGETPSEPPAMVDGATVAAAFRALLGAKAGYEVGDPYPQHCDRCGHLLEEGDYCWFCADY